MGYISLAMSDTNHTTHTNAAGISFFSKVTDEGETIYSFTEEFDDIWTQEDEDFHSLKC